MDEIARLELEFDTSSAEQGASKATQMLDNVGAHASTMGSAMSKALDSLKSGLQFLGLGFGLLKATEALQEAIQLAARYQTLGVVLHQVGEQSGYTGRELNSMALSLQRSGITMRESRSGLIDLIQSNINLAGASNLARVAQDAAVTANLNSSDTYQRVIYGIQSGNSEILRTIGLTVNWNDAYQRMALTLNKSTDDLSEQEQAQARVNEVLHAGVNISGSYESAMTTASKQMRSMERYAEDLKVRLGETFQPAFTAVVFGFAHVLEIAANHTALLSAAVLSLGARALLPAIASARAFIMAQVEMRMSVLQGNSAIVGSGAALRASAVWEATHAEALMLDTKAAYENAAATEFSAKTTEEQAAATAAAATAEAAYAAATTTATAATKAMTAALGVSPFAIIVGVLMAAGLAWDVISTHTAKASEFTNKYSADIDKLDPKLVAASAHMDDLAKKHGVKPSDPKIAEIADDLEQARKNRANLIENAEGDHGPGLGTTGKYLVAIEELNKQYNATNMSAGAYATALSNLSDKNSDLLSLSTQIKESLKSEAKATQDLADAKDAAAGKTKEQAAAQDALNVSMNKAARGAKHEADVSAAHLSILSTQGPRAAERYDAIQKADDATRGQFTTAIAQETNGLNSLTYEQVMGASPSELQKLVYDKIKSSSGREPDPNDTNNPTNRLRREGVRALQLLQGNIHNFAAPQFAKAESDYQAGQTATQQGLTKANRDTYGAADDQRRLAGAYKDGVVATREMEVRVAGLSAARALDATATDAQRAAAGRAAEALTRASQAAQIAKTTTDELTKSHYAAADAAKLSVSYSEGPMAVSRAQRDIKINAQRRPGGALEGANSGQIYDYENEQESQAVDAGKGAIYQLQQKAQGQEKIAAASKVSKQAAFDEAAAVDVLNQTNAMGITDMDHYIDTLDSLTAARKRSDDASNAASNNAALLATQQSTDLTRQETAATLEGVVALEKFKIAKAGIEAGQNYVGSASGKQAAIDAAELQARTGIQLQQASRLAESFRAPLMDAIHDVDRGFESMFEKILDGGMKTFHELGRSVEETLHKMLADFVSEQISNTVRNKLTDIYRQSQGLPTATSSGVGGANAQPTTGIKVDIGAIGGQAVSAMAANAAATGAGGTQSSGGGIGSLLGTIKGLFGGSGSSGAVTNTYGDNVGNANVDYGSGASTMATAGAGLGMAAGGWSIGSTIGKMTTNHAVGALGGAAGGAAAGAAMGAMGGPIGVVAGGIIGGLAGAVSGFMSVGSMSHDAARQLQEGRDSMVNSLSSFKEVSTMAQSIVVDQLRQNTETEQSLIAQANNALPGKKYEAERNTQIQAAKDAAAEGIQTIYKNFTISIDQQLAAAQGTTFEANLYNLKLAFDNNTRSMAAMGATAEEASKATDLYNLSVAKLTREHNLDIQTTKEGMAADTLEIQGATYAASLIRMRAADQKELNDVMEKWGTTNPEIVQSEKDLIKAREARGAVNLSDEQRNGPAGFKIAGYAYEFATLADQFAKNLQATVAAITGTPGIPTVTAAAAPITINLPPGAIAIDGNQTDVEMAQKLVSGLRKVAATHGGPNQPLSQVLDEI